MIYRLVPAGDPETMRNPGEHFLLVDSERVVYSGYVLEPSLYNRQVFGDRTYGQCQAPDDWGFRSK